MRRGAVDVAAVAIGAGVALAVSLPAMLTAQALDASDDIGGDTALVLGLAAVVVVGLGVGAYTAARRRRDASLRHGVLAAVCGFVVVQAAALAAMSASDEDMAWGRIPLTALAAIVAGMLGAFVADRGSRPNR